MEPLKLLFVCRGNTCISPMAESIMQHLLQNYGLTWICDSAGLRNWNIGRHPVLRCQMVMDENGISLTPHSARLITLEDFSWFDYILALDEPSLKELYTLVKKAVGDRCKAKILLLSSYLTNNQNAIKDPCYSKNLDAFRYTFNQIFRSCKNFIENHKMDSSSINVSSIYYY